jgi:hypothetical protein
MTDAAIIDETFAGLTAPLHAIPCGREDLSTRPGDALVALVSEFSAEGGFRRLAEQRRRGSGDVYDPHQPRATDYEPVSPNLSRWFGGDMDDTPEADLA